MMRLLAIGLPILCWLCLILMVGLRKYRGSLLFLGASAVNLLALWQLSMRTMPNFLWVVLLAAILIAVVAIFIQLEEDYDLIFAQYWHRLARILLLSTTIWWLAAIFLTI